jgi:hypothetical protein
MLLHQPSNGSRDDSDGCDSSGALCSTWARFNRPTSRALLLLVAQRKHRIDSRGTQRRNVAGQHRDAN